MIYTDPQRPQLFFDGIHFLLAKDDTLPRQADYSRTYTPDEIDDELTRQHFSPLQIVKMKKSARLIHLGRLKLSNKT